MPQSLADVNIHPIFSTKNRKSTILPDIRDRLHEYLGGLLRSEGCCLLSAGGTPDHLHLLISLGRENSLSHPLRDLKSNSSKWIHETFPAARDFAWQTGYAAFSVSHSNIDAVNAYIAAQPEHHRQVTFKEELLAFLRRHNVQYDERYVFD